MENKCNKYEALFTFGDENDLLEHLKICSDCRKEHDEMLQVASLAKEVKPYIKKKSAKVHLLSKVAACVVVSLIAFSSINTIYNNQKEAEIKLVKENSVIAKMGLPTDDYGLLDIE